MIFYIVPLKRRMNLAMLELIAAINLSIGILILFPIALKRLVDRFFNDKEDIDDG